MTTKLYKVRLYMKLLISHNAPNGFKGFKVFKGFKAAKRTVTKIQL